MISRLEDLCGIKIAIVLANKLEFKKEILRLLDLDRSMWQNDTEPWFKNMSEKVLDTLKELPFVLRNKIPICIFIFCLSQSIGWAKFHKEVFDLPLDYSCRFLTSSFFTSKGIINKEKSAREIVKNTEISPLIRFGIASYYCFSDVVLALHKQLNEENKVNDEASEYIYRIASKENIINLWFRFCLGEHNTMMKEGENFLLYKFRHSLDNDVSFKYCFEELNDLDKMEAVIFCRDELKSILSNMLVFNLNEEESTPHLFPLQLYLPFQPYVEMVKYLLSRLDEKQLKVFFQPDMLFFSLFHLLNWPNQNLFMITVNQFWDILSKNGFCLLLKGIVYLMKNHVSGKLWNYHSIFKDFWLTSPSSFKRFFFRFEGINKTDIDDELTEEEQNEFRKFGLHTKFKHLAVWSVITDCFRTRFTIEDEKIIRLIFESATLEEKSAFVRVNGYTIGEIALYACDIERIELLIELLIPKERVASFKKGLFNDWQVKETLNGFVIYDNRLKELKKILNWALCAEEIKEWQQSLLLYMKQKHFHDFASFDLKCIDIFLEWSLSSDEIKDFKESLVSDVEDIADHCKNLLTEGDYQEIDRLLKWTFSSENEIVKFKKGLAFKSIRHMDYSFISKGLSLLKYFFKWSALCEEEECKDFKRQCAFREGMIEFYSKFVAQSQLHQTDEFIQWAELTETEVKEFKKLLVFVFNEKRNVISACASFILNGKPDFIKELLNWTQFSEEEVGEFYSLLPEELDLYYNFTEKKTKLVDIKNFFSGLPLSENEIKRHKKNILNKNLDAIEYLVMESKWDEFEELLSWGLTSASRGGLCMGVTVNLISQARFDDVHKFSNLMGMEYIRH